MVVIELVVLVVILAVLVVMQLIARGYGWRRRGRVMMMVVMVRPVHVVCCCGGRRRKATTTGHRSHGLLRRRTLGLPRRTDLVAQYPADARHAGHVELVTHAVCEKSVTNFPREHARVLALQPANVRHYPGCGHPGLAAADGSG